MEQVIVVRHTGAYIVALVTFAVPMALIFWGSWYLRRNGPRVTASLWGTLVSALLISTPVPAFLLLSREAETMERVTLGAQSVTFHYRDKSPVQLTRGEVSSANEFRPRRLGLRSSKRIRFVIGPRGQASLETPAFTFAETDEIMRRLALREVPVAARYRTWVLR